MRHFWLDLPGPVWFSGARLYADFVDAAHDGALAVELGAWKGRSACFMGVEIANSGKAIEFYTVDHWQGSPGETEHDIDPAVSTGTLFETFSANTAPVSAHIKAIRDDSVSAAERFGDCTIDFLYIDASHTYHGVLRDLQAWFPKVNIGGIIAGDDWCFRTAGELGVRFAVLDFLGGHKRAVKVAEGSAPNPEWLQWSFVKTADLAPASRAELAFRRAFRWLLRNMRRAKRKLTGSATSRP